MATEEFTFPISAEMVRSFIDSPPLWERLDSTQDTSSSLKQIEQLCSPTKQDHQRKSFSDGYDHHRHRPIEMDGLDRMDLLWEDFNEELHRNQYPFTSNSALTSSDDLPEFGCVPTAFNPSKAVNGRDGPSNKVGLVVLAKVFKRLFVLRQLPVRKLCYTETPNRRRFQFPFPSETRKH